MLFVWIDAGDLYRPFFISVFQGTLHATLWERPGCYTDLVGYETQRAK
jgi:hypothetical protein